MIDPELLSLLVCPLCRGPLVHVEEPTEELHCRTCALAYPVRDDIPMLLRDDARPLGTLGPTGSARCVSG